MRICSLLPSATEIVFALGMGEALVGVSHECDSPAEATKLLKVTRSKIPPGLTSAEIDLAVSSALETQNSLYDLDIELLERLEPDRILTQRLCDVCAVSFDLVQKTARVEELPAVKAGRVFAVDGSSYFSRPGPRMVESLEILAHLVHLELFAPPPLEDAFARLHLRPSTSPVGAMGA